MSRSFPSYLRLHSPESLERRSRGTRPQADSIEQFWLKFAEATGWSVETDRRPGQIRVRCALAGDGVLGAEDLQAAPTISHEAAQQLAEAAAELGAQLRRYQQAVRTQEAQLATSEVAPLVPDPAHCQHSAAALADDLEANLQELCGITGGSRAALYMLDEATSALKLRVSHGWTGQPLVEASRKLRGSLPDLEALVGNVVEVERTPAECGGEVAAAPALCVAVQVADTPVGVLWLWDDVPRRWSASDHAAMRMSARLLAHQLTVDLERNRARRSKQLIGPLRAAGAWQQTQHPPSQGLAPGWRADGWVSASGALASSWYHWDVLPDGQLAVVLAEAHGEGYEAAMIAATARAAWQSHAGYRHTPAQLLQRLSDTLWNCNSAEQRLSIAYWQLDPETGRATFASAGALEGLIASSYGVRPVLGCSDPLGNTIDYRPEQRNCSVERGELLIVYTPGLVARGPLGPNSAEGSPDRLLQQELTRLVEAEDYRQPERLLARLRRAVASLDRPREDRAALVLGRC